MKIKALKRYFLCTSTDEPVSKEMYKTHVTQYNIFAAKKTTK